MPRFKVIERFVSNLQAFHGFNIRVAHWVVRPGTVAWSVQVPDTGASFAGSHAQTLAWLKGYQAGFLTGRKYTRIEQTGLKDLITEVEARFKKSA